MAIAPRTKTRWLPRAWSARWLKLRIQQRELARRWLSILRRGEHAFVVIVAILLGILGAYGAIGFRELIRLAHFGFFGSDSYSIELLESLPWWRRIAQPVLGGLMVGAIVAFFAPEVRGSGIPEVMESVARRGGAIRVRVVLTKAVAAALTIASGGSAGREGPVVHVGAAISSFVGQVLQVSAKRLRTFVACGAAAAIAATFNAPIAGALFAVEVVLGDLGVANLSPIVISSVIATVISRHYLGDFPAFHVPDYHLVDPRELLLYVGLGVVSAVLAVVFIRVLFGVGAFFDRLAVPAWLRPAVGGLCVGLIALGFPHVYGVGYETINSTLWSGRDDLAFLGGLVLAKLLATSLTLGSGGSGGVFAPSLFLGAVVGAAWGQLANLLFPAWTASPGAYALVGMGAMVAATTHAPITAILIIFELTNDYRIIPPLMLSCVLGVLLSTLLHRQSIYTEKLVRRGVRLTDGRDVNLLKALHVRDVMKPSAPVVDAGLPFSQLVPRLLAGKHTELFAVDRTGRLVGRVTLAEIRAAVPDSEELAGLVLTADVADSSIPAVLPDDSLDLVMNLLGKTRGESVPVCEPRTRKVIGVVNQDDVIEAYNRLLAELDLTGEFHSMAAAVQGGRMMEVMRGVYLTEVIVPHSLVGKTIVEARLRQDHGIEVVLVHVVEDSKDESKLPDPSLRFQPGDRLLVMGAKDAIERLRE